MYIGVHPLKLCSVAHVWPTCGPARPTRPECRRAVADDAPQPTRQRPCARGRLSGLRWPADVALLLGACQGSYRRPYRSGVSQVEGAPDGCGDEEAQGGQSQGAPPPTLRRTLNGCPQLSAAWADDIVGPIPSYGLPMRTGERPQQPPLWALPAPEARRDSPQRWGRP